MAVDGEIGADESQQQARHDDAPHRHANHEGRDEDGKAFLPGAEGSDAGIDDAIGEQACQQPHAEGIAQEGAADEAPFRADELHDLYAVAPPRYREAHRVVDERKADEAEQHGDDEQHGRHLTEVLVHLRHEVLRIVHVHHAPRLAELRHEAVERVVAGIVRLQLNLERGRNRTAAKKLCGVAPQGLSLNARGLLLRDVAHMLGIGHTA